MHFQKAVFALDVLHSVGLAWSQRAGMVPR